MGRVSRRDIALSPYVWRVVWLTFGLLTIGVAFLGLTGAAPNPGPTLGLAALLGISTVVLARMAPPDPDTPRTHAVLAMTYVMPAIAIAVFAPEGSAVAMTATFAGPLAAVWIVERKQTALHLSAATIVTLIPSLVGLTDTATLFATIGAAAAMWSLSWSCIILLSATERQGERLAALVKRDPLTGAGNRRLLDEELEIELARHHRGGDHLSILTFDLNGFKALNDTVGHAAGDQMLCATADVLLRNARPRDTVVRQGGDEFCIVLPHTRQDDARVLGELIRASLESVQAFGGGISSGIGLATYPEDAHDAAGLLSVADERLRDDKAQAPNQPLRFDPRGTVPEHPRRDEREATAARPDRLDALTRRELAGNLLTWRLDGGIFGATALLGGLIAIFAPELTRSGVWLAVALTGLYAASFAVSRPPVLASLRCHAHVATTWMIPLLFALTVRPGAMLLAVTMFVGPLAAAKLVDRRQITGHLAVATVALVALAIARSAEFPTVLSAATVIVNLWVLGYSCVIVFESAEAQGEELESLVRRDPLTGLGNRRRLQERMAHELASADRPLAVVVLDLNGFKQLNDTIGHQAGDALLVRVSRALQVVAGTSGEAIRQGGDEFALLLPDTTREEARVATATLERTIGEIEHEGVRISTGIGVATFPEDGDSVDTLLDRADHALRAHKYGDSDRNLRRRASDHDDPLLGIAIDARAAAAREVDSSIEQ